MEATKTDLPLSNPGVGKSYTEKKKDRKHKPVSARIGPSYRELQEKVAVLERATNSLQSTQEIKYLKKQVGDLKRAEEAHILAVLNLEASLQKLGVPQAAIDKLKTNQPVMSYDVTPEFVVLVTPEEGAD